MDKYIGLDCGKFATKISVVDSENDCIEKEFCVRTKIGDGDFRDDAIEDETVVAEYDGKVYKVGAGARGASASLDVNKASETHKICALVALACMAATEGTDEKISFHIGTGLPVSEWANVTKRCDFKDFIFPTGDISVTVKMHSNSKPRKVTFNIAEGIVYPESVGGVTADEIFDAIDGDPDVPTGVIDAGNLNVNVSYFQGIKPVIDKCATSDHGGAYLLEDISQEISSKIDSCDPYVIANILKKPDSERHLPLGYGLTEEQVKSSKKIIEESIRKYVQSNIYALCRSRDWAINSMRIVAIGGTSSFITEELKKQFGNMVVLPDANFCNSRGYAKLLCASSNSYGCKEIRLHSK